MPQFFEANALGKKKRKKSITRKQDDDFQRVEQKKTELSLLLFIASIENKSAISPKIYIHLL